jgi:hypothetical protein
MLCRNVTTLWPVLVHVQLTVMVLERWFQNYGTFRVGDTVGEPHLLTP